MEPALDPSTRDYTGASTRTLQNAVYLRLATPLGSYWADPTLGSRLHELAREKDLARVATLAIQYTEQALSPLLDDGRATAITVTASRPGNGWLWLEIQVRDASNTLQRFQHPVKVS